MKKILNITAFAALLLLAACQNTIKYEYDLNDGKITILGELSTAREEHSVFLSMSYPDRIDSLPDAAVYCYVNGERHQATKIHPGYEWRYDPVTYESILVPVRNRYTEYSFRADFKPGDKVRIEASKGEMKAWAEMEVPSRGEIVSVDTLTLVKTLSYQSIDGSDDYEQEYVEYTVSLRDVKGADSYYTLDADKNTVTRIISEDGTEVEEQGPVKLEYETFHDRILEDDYSSGVGDIFEDLLPVNSTHCFSDKLFRDQEATVKFYVPSYYIKEHLYYFEGDKAEVDVAVHLRFKSFDRSYYNYLRALNNMMCYGFDVNPIVEPTMLPNNVNGGMGMVTIVAEDTWEMILPTKYYDKDDQPNYYIY